MASNSSFYLSGSVYSTLQSADILAAEMDADLAAAQAAQASAAASAAAAAASAAIMTPSAATPLMDGTGAVGVSVSYSRGDHVHPTDTSRAPLASPSFTGNAAVAGDLTWGGAAWTAYTPSVSISGGAGTATGFYKLLGKTLLIKVQVTITTGGASTTFGMPFVAANGNNYIAGREYAVTGNMWTALAPAGGSTFTLFRYDNFNTAVAGHSIAVTGAIEIA